MGGECVVKPASGTGGDGGRSYIEGGFTNASTGTVALNAGTLEFRTLNNDGLITLANGALQSDSLLAAEPGSLDGGDTR